MTSSLSGWKLVLFACAAFALPNAVSCKGGEDDTPSEDGGEGGGGERGEGGEGQGGGGEGGTDQGGKGGGQVGGSGGGATTGAGGGATGGSGGGTGGTSGGAGGTAGSGGAGNCWTLPAVTSVRLWPRAGQGAKVTGGRIEGSNDSPTNGFVEVAKINAAPADGMWTDSAGVDLPAVARGRDRRLFLARRRMGDPAVESHQEGNELG